MSEIKVGDLVVVVKPAACCGCTSLIGKVYRVNGITEQTNHECVSCGVRTTGVFAIDTIDPVDRRWWSHDIRRLKRIPPLSELEGEKREEEITA